MPPSIPSPDNDVSRAQTTPSKTSRTASKKDASATAPQTPQKNGSSPKRASSSDSSPVPVARVRPRANSRKEPPTLLTDFFRGKPSPTRLAADRKRRQSVEMVKAEMRKEMRQSSVRKLQQPGGVKERVQKWQKAHAEAVVDGIPDDAATEPTDVAFKGEDLKSVTESDRVRIKLRQTRRSTSKQKTPPGFVSGGLIKEEENENECATPQVSPPKKRVVSDEHWRKSRARKSPPSGRYQKSPKGLPLDFGQESGGNPLVSSKVKEWAAKVDQPETPLSRSHRSSKWRPGTAPAEATKSEAGDSPGDIEASWVTKQKMRRDDRSREDEGVGVRPTSGTSRTNPSRDHHSRGSRSQSKTTSGSGRPSSPSARTRTTPDPADIPHQTGDQRNGREISMETCKRSGSTMPDTPTQRTGPPRQRPTSFHGEPAVHADESSCLSEGRSNVGRSTRKTASDVASSLTIKSIVDIPGDIPFGHSAFSELDVTMPAKPTSKPKRNKVEGTTSLKSVPKVLKRVVQEGKKIIHDMNEPPRHQVANDPPSIEKWLNNTVDPCVETEPITKAVSPSAELPEGRTEKGLQDTAEPRRRNSHATKSSQKSSSNLGNTHSKQQALGNPDASKVQNTSSVPESAVPTTTVTSPTSAALKRSRATRSGSSPVKVSGRRQLLGVLKEAFQGESGAHSVRPKSYQASEQQKVPSVEDVPSPRQREGSIEPLSATSDATNSGQRRQDEEPLNVKLAAPRFRPPTRGDHELSTIVSEEGANGVDSDLSSDLSQSTLTQSTVLTKESENNPKPHTNQTPGLKRRLTKHSDLVSVLSLPNDSSVPETIKRHRSRPSLRKHRSASGSATAQELLREFIDDESMYMRELKTLVDGVVPVLLSHVLNGTNATELFGPSASSPGKIPGVISKSVVSMGVALEKLKNAHKKAPTSDIRRMANWAHGVVPMYDSYLSTWRLGFDDVVINLAPAADGMNDDESLLGALPRNEKGDVVNDDGERVAVAYLLKRPLIRVKQLTKLVKCADALPDSTNTRELLQDFENLQAKARRRFREETARVVDEEAICTDTSRCRDLESLKSSSAVTIDPTRQVSAKDVFSLSLSHSNGQRLDCQVELVHRDNKKDSSDEGDLLIREIGEGRRSYLLFQPIAMSKLSARTGDGHFEMVIMIRGTSLGKPWREFITLKADNEDQILDWLDILPILPAPPLKLGPQTSAGSPKSMTPTLPTTPPRRRESPTATPSPSSVERSPRSPIAKDISTTTPPPASAEKPIPLRYHRQRTPTKGRTPSPVASRGRGAADPDKTPTREGHQEASWHEDRGRPLKESMRPGFSHLVEKKQEGPQPKPTPYREEGGAPPPPVHRTLSTSPKTTGRVRTNSAPSLPPPPPADIQGPEKLKRRGSSPLKHEYLPSDQSSASEAYSSEEEESEHDSSDDDFESLDIPETELGISIKDDGQSSQSHAAPHFRLESECSLSPSHSASQTGLHGYENAIKDPVTLAMARISRWSDKGVWRDISRDACCIVVRDGVIEAYSLRTAAGPSDTDLPLLALDLTPLVLIRQSTVVDLEIRSSVQPHSRVYRSHNRGNFRFRCSVAHDCFTLYMAVHQARLNNQKFIQLENEARFRSFGERQTPKIYGDSSSSGGGGGGGGGGHSWFGRKNSYRSSVRTSSHSQDGGSSSPSSTPSATSFLKRLTLNGNLSFNLARSSVDRRSRANSCGNSLYTSRSSSGSGTPPGSPSVSIHNGSHDGTNVTGSDSIRVRLHLLVTPAKWEDYGNCSLQIRRPPPGWRQALRANHGLEKRITVTTLPKKESDEGKVVLDAVLGSGCFSAMGSRGIVCGVWEEVKNGEGVVGKVPETGATGGNIRKWCFQFSNAGEANGVLRLVHQEVVRA